MKKIISILFMILLFKCISYLIENYNFDIGVQEEKISIVNVSPTDELIINFALSQDGKVAAFHKGGNVNVWSASGEYLYTFEFTTDSSNYIIKYNEENEIELIEYKGHTKYILHDDGKCLVSKTTESNEEFEAKYDYYDNRKEIKTETERYYLTNRYPITKYLVRKGYTRLCVEKENGEITYIHDGSKKELGMIVRKLLLIIILVSGITGGCIYFFKYFDPDKLNC